jgi:hypothetical protein
MKSIVIKCENCGKGWVAELEDKEEYNRPLYTVKNIPCPLCKNESETGVIGWIPSN